MTDDQPIDVVRRFCGAWGTEDEVIDGKIAAWRDYFDLAMFMSQMPQA